MRPSSEALRDMSPCTTSRPRRSKPKCSTRHGTQSTGTSDIIGGSDVSVAEGHTWSCHRGRETAARADAHRARGRRTPRSRSMLLQLLEVADAIYVIVTNPVRRADGARAGGYRPAAGAHLRVRHGARHLAPPLAARPSRGRRRPRASTYIVGEHGDTEFPLWSPATIGTVPILDFEPSASRA